MSQLQLDRSCGLPPDKNIAIYLSKSSTVTDF